VTATAKPAARVNAFPPISATNVFTAIPIIPAGNDNG
jgi:hypothetical protein